MTDRVMHPDAEPLHLEQTRPDGSKVGVLVCHGFTGSPASMRPWAYDLAGRGFTIALPRLPGHGTNWHDLARTTWHDWYQTVDAEYAWLAERCECVFVVGLSMGGALAIRISEHHNVAGVTLVNPALAASAKKYKFLPLLSKLISSMPAIANDIKRPGVDERAYPRTPLKAAASMIDLWDDVVPKLDQISAPVLLFTSREDHIVDCASGRLLTARIKNIDHRWLENSYHVATLDNDDQLIFDSSAEFFEKILCCTKK